MSKKKETRGRKSLPEKELKRHFFLSVKAGEIEELGGVEACQNISYNALSEMLKVIRLKKKNL